MTDQLLTNADLEAIKARLSETTTFSVGYLATHMKNTDDFDATLGGQRIIAIDPVTNKPDLFHVKFRHPDDDLFVPGDANITVYTKHIPNVELLVLVAEIERLQKLHETDAYWHQLADSKLDVLLAELRRKLERP